MIRVDLAESAEEGEWEALVERCGGNALHLPAIHFADFDSKSRRLLTFGHDGRIVACALAFDLSGRRLRGLLRGPRVLQLPTAPAIGESTLAVEVWDSLVRFACDSGFDRLKIQPGYGRWLDAAAGLARYRTISITEFVMDLRRPQEEILAAVHKNHRKNIRRARRQGLRVEEDNSVPGLLRLRDMQLASAERASERTEGFGVRGEDFFHQLHEHVYARGYGHLLFALIGDDPVAALAWLSAAKRVLTVRSGSLPAGYETRAMYLLYDELIHRAYAEEMSELNIGGVPVEASDPAHPQSGLFEFKNGFGAQPLNRHGLDIDLKEIGR